MSSKKKAKRFYKEASVSTLDDGFGVKLDSRNLRTPGKQALIIPHLHIAQLIADEWNAQGEYILAETMAVTRLINVAIERTPDNRDGLISEVEKYAGTDLLCYREDNLRVLAERQTQLWDPVLAWAERAHGIILKPISGIVHMPQAQDSLSKAAEFAEQQNNIDLTLLAHFTASFGSAILAIALMEGYLTASKALELSRLDELYQIELWGQDEEAAERSDNISAEILALASILDNPQDVQAGRGRDIVTKINNGNTD